jgi:uroporphyrinogen-III synthase
MPQNKIHILCTRPVDESFIERAGESGLALEIVSFIETEPIQTVEVQQEIEQALTQSAAVIFTSANAVEAVVPHLDGLIPEWQIFCLGHKTKQIVTKYFGEEFIAGIGNDATELAEVIKETIGTDEVIFFCGNQRRPDLPQILHEEGIRLNEIVVYQTIGLPRKLKSHYQGILFFSPTAVDSFFKLNKANDKTIFFAIGNTTAAEIKKHTKNKILVSEEPVKENVLEMAIEYFT